MAGLDRPDSFWNQQLQSVKDTVVAGINCRKLVMTEKKRINGGTAFDGPPKTFFVYDNTDTVFFYAEDAHRFVPLYVFNVSEGDTVHLSYFDLSGQPFIYIVDSIKSELYDTSHLKSFYTHVIPVYSDTLGYSNNWGFAKRSLSNEQFEHKGKYTEKIGGYLGFFPTKCLVGNIAGGPPSIHVEPAGILQCYSDNTIHYKANDTACDFLPSPAGLAETFVSQFDILVAPNPAHGHVYFTGIGMNLVKEITVYDVTGRKIQALTISDKHYNPQLEMDIKGWLSGVYIIMFSGNGFSLSQRLAIIP